MDILAYVIPGRGRLADGGTSVDGGSVMSTALTSAFGVIAHSGASDGVLVGSIPGIILGSLIGKRLPETILRRTLAFTLLAMALYLI